MIRLLKDKADTLQIQAMLEEYNSVLGAPFVATPGLI
jgi:hypothetical protein